MNANKRQWTGRRAVGGAIASVPLGAYSRPFAFIRGCRFFLFSFLIGHRMKPLQDSKNLDKSGTKVTDFADFTEERSPWAVDRESESVQSVQSVQSVFPDFRRSLAALAQGLFVTGDQPAGRWVV
jgi:hypothetical protein